MEKVKSSQTTYVKNFRFMLIEPTPFVYTKFQQAFKSKICDFVSVTAAAAFCKTGNNRNFPSKYVKFHLRNKYYPADNYTKYKVYV